MIYDFKMFSNFSIWTQPVNTIAQACNVGDSFEACQTVGSINTHALAQINNYCDVGILFRAICILVHGFGEHVHHYEPVAKVLYDKHDISLCGYDQGTGIIMNITVIYSICMYGHLYLFVL